MKQLAFTLLLAIGLTASSFAQGKAYREKFTQGNYLILEQNYQLALDYFLEAYKIDSTNANINYKIGLCYLQTPTQKKLALPYLKKAITNVTHNYDETNPSEKKAPENAYLLVAEAYRLDYKFTESNIYYNMFKELVGTNNKELTDNLSTQIERNFNAIEFTKDTAIATITNAGDSINTIYPDYSPVVSSDGSTMIFTSRRQGSTGGEKTSTDEFYEDIYYSVKDANGKWSKAQNIGQNINTVYNEAALSLSADGQQLFIYRDVNGGDIFYSNQLLEGWSAPQPLDAVNSAAWETHASLSPDGRTLFFVSDRKEGGFGGRDIWRCVMLPSGKWSLPVNLGPTINTAEDEDAPFMHADGTTLFFSSKGHKNMGGFDIFKSTLMEDNAWTTPQNMQAPINTPDDDIFYMQSSDGRKGYFSSVRDGGFGSKDIYEVTYFNPFLQPLTVVTGYMTFNGIKKVPAGVRITATDLENNAIVQEVKPNISTGKYVLILNAGTTEKNYSILYEAPNYQPVTIRIVIPPGAEYREIEKELSLKFVNLESKTSGTIGIKGTIKNEEGELLKQATITVKDNVTGQLIHTYYADVDSGYYYFALNHGQNYNISFEAKGYLFQSINVNVPKQPEYTTMTKNIVLEKVKAGSRMVLNNIFFDSNKSTLRKESNTEIEKVVAFLTEYPDIKVEVDGHTDNKGQDAVNMKLSQARAEAVVNAIVQKGIPKIRLLAKGFGKTQPIAPNTLPNGKPDVNGMQLNRRVELRIIENQYPARK
jgi:outer membrane protein OmpA-like peptidoglycan-associated protein/Tol biopolymer transport system component